MFIDLMELFDLIFCSLVVVVLMFTVVSACCNYSPLHQPTPTYFVIEIHHSNFASACCIETILVQHERVHIICVSSNSLAQRRRCWFDVPKTKWLIRSCCHQIIASIRSYLPCQIFIIFLYLCDRSFVSFPSIYDTSWTHIEYRKISWCSS